MKDKNSATANQKKALPANLVGAGMGWGLLGVLIFSFTLPLTRMAVETLDPLFVGAGRAVVAGILAAGLLLLTRQAAPSIRQWLRLGVVAAGVVMGFPLLTSFALQQASSSHGAVIVGLLPAITAVVSVLRTGERPGRTFWVASTAGAAAVLVFVTAQGAALHGPGWDDLLLLCAVASAAAGYAEGGLLARELGPWQTICWALVLSLPVMTAVTVVAAAAQPPQAGLVGWLSFAYISVFSMFLGFFAWYRGLGIGPMSRISQIQLIQPVLTIIWSAWILNEELTPVNVAGAIIVLACAAVAVTSRVAISARDKPGPSEFEPTEGTAVGEVQPLPTLRAK
jgi:drug/metabolite transporter (DMT)-like permease